MQLSNCQTIISQLFYYSNQMIYSFRVQVFIVVVVIKCEKVHQVDSLYTLIYNAVYIITNSESCIFVFDSNIRRNALQSVQY